tara:strand:+ start:8795 stop:8947 length:153 start_codon:yes stop_codon:yes gene_type:complete
MEIINTTNQFIKTVFITATLLVSLCLSRTYWHSVAKLLGDVRFRTDIFIG